MSYLLSRCAHRQGETDPQTVAHIGWSVLILLLVATYTANLAAFLVVSSVPSPSITSLQDAANAKANVCIQATAAIFITVHYPDVTWTILDDNFLTNPLKEYAERGCDAIVLTMEDVQYGLDMAGAVCYGNLFAVQLITVVRPEMPHGQGRPHRAV